MGFNQLPFIFNRVTYILNEIFIKYNNYKITNTRFNTLNNQFELFIGYEIPGAGITFHETQLISIPTWLLEHNTNKEDIETFIKEMQNNIRLF